MTGSRSRWSNPPISCKNESERYYCDTGKNVETAAAQGFAGRSRFFCEIASGPAVDLRRAGSAGLEGITQRLMPAETPVYDPQQSSTTSPRSRGAGASGSGHRNESSLLDLLLIVVQRRRTVVSMIGCCTLLALLLAFLLPKEYTAEVILLPPQQGSSLSSTLGSELEGLDALAKLAGGGLGIKNPNDMYVAMLKSQTVENGMVQRFGLMREYRRKLPSQARKAFEDHVTIRGNGKDGLIHISVEDGNPQRAAALANGYVDEFRALSQHLAITEAGQRALFFHGQLEQAKDKLADAEESLVQMEQTSGVIEPASQARALIDAGITLRAQIAAKQVQIQALQTFATGQNAQLVEAQQELKSLQDQLARLAGSRQNPNSLIIPKGKVPQASEEYVRRLRDVKYYETIFEVLARQYELAKLDQAKEGALIQVVDPAVVPDHKSSPRRLLILIIGFVFGVFVGILVALLQDGWKSMKEDPEFGSKIASICAELRAGARKLE
jgi:tyrosine-protein kinase Etk/Wzc